MGLREEFVEEWKGYIEVLKDNNVKIEKMMIS
jgi:N-dimethylarginine dimethylaminohydrolase